MYDDVSGVKCRFYFQYVPLIKNLRNKQETYTNLSRYTYIYTSTNIY